jgi:multidrug efflux pump
MSFTDVFIRRPVFAIAINLMMMLAGIVSLSRLAIRQYPMISPSVITVTVVYDGAPAGLMEGFVATPIENAITGVNGIDYIKSTSQQSQTQITIYMKVGFDADAALTNISAKVSSVRYELPVEINDPVISKDDPDMQPVIYISFESSIMTGEQITDFLIRAVQPQFQTLDGVSSADIYGEREYAARIWLNPQLMAAKKVTGNDIWQVLNMNNVQAAAGNIKGPLQQFDIYSSTDLREADKFNDMVIRSQNNNLVKIKDVGYAKLGAQDVDSSVLVDGLNTVLIGVTPENTANPLQVAKETKDLLPIIDKSLPQGLTYTIIKDDSIYIQTSLDDVEHTIFIASILVFLVIYLMIGSFRAVLIPIVTIPLSLFGVCILMFAMGFTINVLTLLAFVLAIGLVIDDAIVVLENVHRHLEEGLSPIKAASVGAKEISFAVIAMTCTLASAYIPVGFMTGISGTLFAEFAFTLAGSVIVSGFIALTLSPMMCSRLYRGAEDLHGGMAEVSDKTFVYIRKKYKALLTSVFKRRYLVVIGAIIIYISCVIIFFHSPAELAPTEDQGYLVAIAYTPETSNIDYTTHQTDNIGRNIYSKFPEIKHYAMINGLPHGVNSAISLIVFTDWSKRKKTAMQIAYDLYPLLWNLPGVQMYVSNPAPLPGTTGYTPVAYVLKTTNTYAYLNKWQYKIMDEMVKWGGLRNLDTDLKIDKMQVDVDIDRDKAGDMGIQMEDISKTLNIFLGQPDTTRFDLNGRSYEVIPQIIRKYRSNPMDISEFNIRTASNTLIPLSNVATIGKETEPRTMNHFQQLRSATLTANLSPGYTQSQALEYLNKLADKMLPRDVQTDTTGQLRQFIQAQGSMWTIYLFSVLFIYLILAAQFESFVDPFIVMLSVPLSIFGALVVLRSFGGTINIYTEIGFVTLIGLISKHGILIVEFANQLQDRGMSIREAILESSAVRLRPVLMTTVAMVLGALPLVFATGAGAVSRVQTGLVIVGGMSFGTILTLLVVPTAYSMIAEKRKPLIDLDAD